MRDGGSLPEVEVLPAEGWLRSGRRRRAVDEEGRVREEVLRFVLCGGMKAELFREWVGELWWW
jgi:hypothetical protein